MNRSISAYEGSEPYVFVCYAHADANTVFVDLKELDDHGIRLWFDEGIPAGTPWRAEIAAAIKGAERLIFFISKASLQSVNCIREVDYALDNGIDIVPVYLEECRLPAELELVLNRVQALFRMSDQAYMEHLLGALQKGTGFVPRLPAQKNRKFGIWLPVLLVTAGILVFQNFVRENGPDDSNPEISNRGTGPVAYDRYLEGLELIGRWDKGDNLETAIGLFREAVNLDPNFALAYARLADANRLRYTLTGNVSWLDQAQENANAAVQLNPDLAPVQVAMSRIHAMLGNLDLAFAAVERALSIDPNHAAANQAIAKLYERQGRLQDAEASFQKALALAPEDLVIRDSYANYLFRQSKFEEAAGQWRTVIDQAPDHFGALVNLGSALNEVGNIPEAITMYEKAIDIRPSYMAYLSLGTAYFRAEQYPEAVDALQSALEMDDSDWLAWGNLAFTYSRMNEMEEEAAEAFDRAIHLAETARKQHPRDPYVHSDLGLYYANTTQPEMALQRVETAITLSPDSGEILAAAAETLELIGHRDRAIELARKYLEFGFPIQRLQRNPEGERLLQDSRLQDLPK